MASSPPRFLPTRLNVIPAVLALVGLGILIYALVTLAIAAPPDNAADAAKPPSTQTSTTPDDPATRVNALNARIEELTTARDRLKDRLDAISQQATHAQWLLSIVLAAAGLLTLAQGFFAFFNVQNYVKQSEDSVKRVSDTLKAMDEAAVRRSDDAVKRVSDGVKVMDDLAKDVRARYPMFSDVEQIRADAFNELSRLSPTLDVDNENLYEKSGPLERQKIFAIENLSAIQMVGAASRSPEVIRNLRLLGKFYASKYRFESPRSLAADAERALYYMDLAAQKSNWHYSVLNDLGWLYAVIPQLPDAPNRAVRHFERSLESRPDQQRALYNLGTLSWKRGNKARLEAGLDWLQQARRQPNWEEKPESEMAAHIDYNIACFYDGLAAIEADASARGKLLDECASALEKAAPAGKQPRKLIDFDLSIKGDLVTLWISAAHATRLDTIRGVYAKAWQDG